MLRPASPVAAAAAASRWISSSVTVRVEASHGSQTKKCVCVVCVWLEGGATPLVETTHGYRRYIGNRRGDGWEQAGGKLWAGQSEKLSKGDLTNIMSAQTNQTPPLVSDSSHQTISDSSPRPPDEPRPLFSLRYQSKFLRVVTLKLDRWSPSAVAMETRSLFMFTQWPTSVTV